MLDRSTIRMTIGALLLLGVAPSAGRPALASLIQSLYVSSPDMASVWTAQRGEPSNPFATSGTDFPTGIAVGQSGRVLVGFAGDNAIGGFEADGTLAFTVATGSGGTPFGLATEASGTILAIEQGASVGVLGRYSENGDYLGVAATLVGSAPYALAIDTAQRIFYTDSIDGYVRRAGTDDTYSLVGQAVVGIAAGVDGLLYLAAVDGSNRNTIIRLDVDRGQADVFADLSELQPQALAFDARGHLFVSIVDQSLGSGGILELSRDGTSFGTYGEDLLNPTFLAFSPAVAVPEPSSLAGLAVGLVITLLYAGRKGLIRTNS